MICLVQIRVNYDERSLNVIIRAGILQARMFVIIFNEFDFFHNA